jgi:curved DNA-binding protein CbpA
VSPSASSEEIKSAYRRCTREAHPDCRGSVERFRAMQTAYTLLIDPAKRTRYDAKRRAWMAQIHAVECTARGHANRLTRLLPEGHIARCW